MSALVGENAQFHCSGSGITIVWTVDGLLATDSVIVARGITPVTMTSSGTVQSTLTVPATLENNGTTVQCRVLSLNGATVSNNGTLNILPGEWIKKLKRFLSKSKGFKVVKSTTGSQCKLTRNKHGMVTRLTC